MTKLPTGNFITFCKPNGIGNSYTLYIIVTLQFLDLWIQKYALEKLGLPNSSMVTPMGTLAPVGDPKFNKYLIQRLHNPHIVRPRTPFDSRGYGTDKRSSSPSVFAQRAKLGYQYWMNDKPISSGTCK